VKDYWSMSDTELEAEALQHNIGGYGVTMGGRTWIDREAIIRQLLARDAALAAQRTLPVHPPKNRKIGF
jgi:hypothetical protein